jgi:hypothetical protein
MENMKTTNLILFTAALAATLTAVNVPAQYQPTGADGITASPKLRQMLNERQAASRPSVLVPTVITVTSVNPGSKSITASPKVRQMLAGQKVIVSGAPYAEVATAGYEPNSPDGIAASPKVRQRLSERTTEFMIAPLK